MKQYRIRAKTVPTTNITVEGKTHYYFESEQLGSVRAVFVSSQETISKEKMLENLIDCDERLSLRCNRYLMNYFQAETRESKYFWMTKYRAVNKATVRLSYKISALKAGE